MPPGAVGAVRARLRQRRKIFERKNILFENISEQKLELLDACLACEQLSGLCGLLYFKHYYSVFFTQLVQLSLERVYSMLLSTSPGLVHAGTVNDDENVNRTERIVRLSHLIKKKKYVLIRNVFFSNENVSFL